MNTISNTGRWGDLSRFTVEFASPSDRLYGNGLQQVQLKVGVEITDTNGNPVKVEHDDVKEFVLIDYARGTVIPHARPRAGASPANVQWDWSNERDRRYKFYPAQGALPEADGSASAGQTILYRDFWVRSKARVSLEIGAKITLRDGTEFTSKGMGSGSVTVVPLPVPTYSPRDYTLKATTISDRGVAHDYIPFSLRARGVLMEFADFSMAPVSLAKHSRRANPNYVVAAFTGYTAPGQQRVRYSVYNPALPSEVSHDFLRPWQPVILVGRYGFNLTQSPVPDANRAGRISAVDRYGNPHALTINFTTTNVESRQVSLV